METKNELITKFLANKELAIVGISRNKKKFGYKVFELFLSKGYTLYPVHPETTEIDGVVCYKSVHEIPNHVKNIYVTTPARVAEDVAIEIANRGFEMVWVQQLSDTKKALQILNDKNIPYIAKRCIFMYLEPTGGHKAHRFFYKLFGKL